MRSAQPALTVDCVIFASDGVVLIKRGHDPFKGCYALPGGFVEVGETVEDACKREVLEETGLILTKLKLVGVYSELHRDPRGHSVSVAFLGEADISTLRAGDDASHVEVVRDWRNNSLAFDHKKMIGDAYKSING